MAGLPEHAANLRGLEALTSVALARKAVPSIEDARQDAFDAEATRRAAAVFTWADAGDAACAALGAVAVPAAGAGSMVSVNTSPPHPTQSTR